MPTSTLPFYRQFIDVLRKSGLPFVLSGTYAVTWYTGIKRPTKDIDIFCKASDYPQILSFFQEKGFRVKVLDERWLAKVYQGKRYADVIFGSIPGFWPITDSWFERALPGKVYNLPVNMTPPEELIVSKMYRQGRDQFDGADVIHLILKQGKNLNWQRLLDLAEPNWEVLYAHIIMFRFVYPSERGVVPPEFLRKMMERIEHQLKIPVPVEKVSRGTILSHRDYAVGYTDWGFKALH